MKRKEVWELGPEDFSGALVWAFAGDDGATSSTLVTAVDPADFDFDIVYLTAGRFISSDREEWAGFLFPDPDISISQPCIFTPAGPLTFWSGIVPPSRERMESWYSKLRKQPSHLFPIQWRCKYGRNRSEQIGTIDGFGYREGGSRKVVW